jgi:acyl-CoA dehydrogenase
MLDLDTFRRETRAWLEDHAPDSLRGAYTSPIDGEWGGRRANPTPDRKRWLDLMAERGFTAPTWPTEYGGAGLSSAEAAVLQEELRRLRLPPPLVGFGLVMLGPTLLDLGTDAQKRQFLPLTARGEIRWCQGYSEPNAGSDLAALQTRAVRDGDELVVTGQKVWTSYADLSDYLFCLVRTHSEGKKQAGITFLLIDMASPGVTTRPLRLISGSSPFCEVFLDEVRVPVGNVVGALDGGWAVAKHLLRYERTMVGDLFGSQLREHPERLVAEARAAVGERDGQLADAVVRDRLARLEMDARAFALTLQRVHDAARAGQRPGPESSLLKVFGTELNQRRLSLRMALAGERGLGWEGPGFTPDELALTRDWLRSRGNTIEGGTTEIQLNIIAKHVLGLPD